MSDLSTERAARNEAVFRDANERIEERVDELSLVGGRTPFLCECDDPACVRPLRLTIAEYEAVREYPRRFIVAPGHWGGEAMVVREHDAYQVIEKRGEEGSIAGALDPR